MLWHKTIEKAEESYQASLKLEPQRQQRRAQRGIAGDRQRRGQAVRDFEREARARQHGERPAGQHLGQSHGG